MLEHKKIQNLSDYFVELNSRREKGVYFYRINGYSEEVGEFRNIMIQQEEPEWLSKGRYLIPMRGILHIIMK